MLPSPHLDAPTSKAGTPRGETIELSPRWQPGHVWPAYPPAVFMREGSGLTPEMAVWWSDQAGVVSVPGVLNHPL